MFYFDCVTIQIFFLNLQKWLSDQERWDKGVTTHRLSEAIKAETLHIRPLSTFILAQLCGVFPPRLKLLDPHVIYQFKEMSTVKCRVYLYTQF